MPPASHQFSEPSAQPVNQPVHLRVQQWMRSTPLRLTVIRLAVVRVLEQAADPLSAETIYRLLCGQGSSISLATTYRVLKELEASGLVGRVLHHDALGTRSFYAIHVGTQRPRACYFQCDLCGVRRRLPAPTLIDQLVNAASHEGYQAQAELVVIARCPDCQARQPVA
jgi:Fur family ferric uptake transcriptional regulator